MRVYLGADHAGFELKNQIADHLRSQGHEVVDCGAHTYDALDDYPAFCIAAATRTVADPGSLGIVLGGSGNGEQIAANKVPGARCALAWSVETAELARQHNNAQLIGIGGRMHTGQRLWLSSMRSSPHRGRRSRAISAASTFSPSTSAPASPRRSRCLRVTPFIGSPGASSASSAGTRSR